MSELEPLGASPSIRPASRADLPALCELMAQLGDHPVSLEDMENRLELVEASAIDELFVLEAEGRVQGLLGFRIRENIEERSCYGEISVLVTDQSSRQLGFGRRLMEYAEALASEKGCKGTWLVSGFAREEEAHRFYEKLGYRVTGYRFVKEAAR